MPRLMRITDEFVCNPLLFFENGFTWEISMPPAGSKFFSARILERRDISPDLWAIRVDPGGEYPYRSGQYATLGRRHSGKASRAALIPSFPRPTKKLSNSFLSWCLMGR